MCEAHPQQTHRQVEELRDGQWRNYLTDHPFTWGNYVTADTFPAASPKWSPAESDSPTRPKSSAMH
jgi:hypothetical protein